ncbi:MAG: hypothetical protein JSU00_23060 [Acidobacteria bacterium]|nr:hypothetical protein [Acidobacteriota bacterium]
MRLTRSQFVAVSSCLFIACAPAAAARRPRYGGRLRIETSAVVTSLDPAVAQPGSFDLATKRRILGSVFETLVRLDEKGEPQPWLAASWTHDPTRHRWLFAARPDVTLHNGAKWDPPGGVVAVDDRRPIEDILRGLANPQNAIVVRGPDGVLLGTGPFRIAEWRPGQALRLEANDSYWGGRPYLDAVEIRMGRAKRDQSIDLDAGRADVVEVAASEVRRVQQRGGRVVLSAPVEVLALVLDAAPPGLERALLLAVDRAAIYNVLLQRTGVISGALLPNWLTGYSFVFPANMDIARARELAGKQAVTFQYDQQDPMIRSIAERVALNAGEAGVTLRPVAGGPAAVRLVHARLSTAEPGPALVEIAAAFDGQAPRVSSADPAQLYAAESGVIASRRIIPLFHLPAAVQIGANVRGWPSRNAGIDRWPLDEAWVEDRAR